MIRVLPFVFLLVSCSAKRFIYSPAVSVNPFFTKKGDSKLAAGYSVSSTDAGGSGGYNKGLDVQCAYAIASNWAVTGDYFYRSEKDVYNTGRDNLFDSSIARYKRDITSFGIGYFTPINRKRTILFNIYAGVGFGKFMLNDIGLVSELNTSGTINLSPYSKFFKAHITKWYVQPAFNFTKGKYFHCSLATRLSVVKYSKTTTSYSNNELDYFSLNNLDGRTLLFWEPSFNIQAGIPHCNWIKITTGFTLCTGIGSYDRLDNADYYHYRTANAYAGLDFNFSKLVKK